MTQTSPEVDRRDPEPRLRAFFDRGTLRLLAPRDDSGVLYARGRVDGTPVIAFATDATRQGGVLGVAGCGHIVTAVDAAVRERVPVAGLWHSAGVRPAALDGAGQVFAALVRASGRVPQLSVVLGPVSGGAAYGPALTDIVITNTENEPRAHVITANEDSALQEARRLAVLLGRQGRFSPDDVTPRSFPVYDIQPLISALLDEPGVELHGGWAPTVVTTLGRFAGRTTGVIANNGCLDAAAAEKAARFVRMCDSLGVPLIVLADVSGPAQGQDGAKLLHAFAEAVVPRVTLVMRRAYGEASIAMNSRSLGATAVLAWPDAEVAVVDDVIEPGQTRRRVAEALAAAPAGRGTHGTIPL